MSSAILLALLTACSTQAMEEANLRHRQNYHAQLASRCDSYGFQRGTTAFAQCMQTAAIQAFQENQQTQQDTQAHFRRAQCYATGRLDC